MSPQTQLGESLDCARHYGRLARINTIRAHNSTCKAPHYAELAKHFAMKFRSHFFLIQCQIEDMAASAAVSAGR